MQHILGTNSGQGKTSMASQSRRYRHWISTAGHGMMTTFYHGLCCQIHVQELNPDKLYSERKKKNDKRLWKAPHLQKTVWAWLSGPLGVRWAWLSGPLGIRPSQSPWLWASNLSPGCVCGEGVSLFFHLLKKDNSCPPCLIGMS